MSAIPSNPPSSSSTSLSASFLKTIPFAQARDIVTSQASGELSTILKLNVEPQQKNELITSAMNMLRQRLDDVRGIPGRVYDVTILRSLDTCDNTVKAPVKGQEEEADIFINWPPQLKRGVLVPIPPELRTKHYANENSTQQTASGSGENGGEYVPGSSPHQETRTTQRSHQQHQQQQQQQYNQSQQQQHGQGRQAGGVGGRNFSSQDSRTGVGGGGRGEHPNQQQNSGRGGSHHHNSNDGGRGGGRGGRGGGSGGGGHGDWSRNTNATTTSGGGGDDGGWDMPSDAEGSLGGWSFPTAQLPPSHLESAAAAVMGTSGSLEEGDENLDAFEEPLPDKSKPLPLEAFASAAEKVEAERLRLRKLREGGADVSKSQQPIETKNAPVSGNSTSTSANSAQASTTAKKVVVEDNNSGLHAALPESSSSHPSTTQLPNFGLGLGTMNNPGPQSSRSQFSSMIDNAFGGGPGGSNGSLLGEGSFFKSATASVSTIGGGGASSSSSSSTNILKSQQGPSMPLNSLSGPSGLTMSSPLQAPPSPTLLQAQRIIAPPQVPLLSSFPPQAAIPPSLLPSTTSTNVLQSGAGFKYGPSDLPSLSSPPFPLPASVILSSIQGGINISQGSSLPTLSSDTSIGGWALPPSQQQQQQQHHQQQRRSHPQEVLSSQGGPNHSQPPQPQRQGQPPHQHGHPQQQQQQGAHRLVTTGGQVPNQERSRQQGQGQQQQGQQGQQQPFQQQQQQQQQHPPPRQAPVQALLAAAAAGAAQRQPGSGVAVSLNDLFANATAQRAAKSSASVVAAPAVPSTTAQSAPSQAASIRAAKGTSAPSAVDNLTALKISTVPVPSPFALAASPAPSPFSAASGVVASSSPGASKITPRKM